jgi:hypothetical protein
MGLLIWSEYVLAPFDQKNYLVKIFSVSSVCFWDQRFFNSNRTQSHTFSVLAIRGKKSPTTQLWSTVMPNLESIVCVGWKNDLVWPMTENCGIIVRCFLSFCLFFEAG